MMLNIVPIQHMKLEALLSREWGGSQIGAGLLVEVNQKEKGRLYYFAIYPHPQI